GGATLVALLRQLLGVIGGHGLRGQGLRSRCQVGELATALTAHPVVAAGRSRVVALAGQVGADDVVGDVDRSGAAVDQHVGSDVVRPRAVDQVQAGAELDLAVAAERRGPVDLALADRGALGVAGDAQAADDGGVDDVGVGGAVGADVTGDVG